MYEEPDEDFEQHIDHASNDHTNPDSRHDKLTTSRNGRTSDNSSPQISEDGSGASSASRLPTIRPASRRANGNGGRSPTPSNDATVRSSNSRSRPQSNPTRLLNSPYVGDLSTNTIDKNKSTSNSRRRRNQSPSPTPSTFILAGNRKRSGSLQRISAISPQNHTATRNHSGFEQKIAEDFAQELLNVKKLAQTLTADNQALKTRVKRLQDENLRRSRELEQVLEHAPESEFAVLPGSSAAVIKRLKTRLMRMEIMLKEKQQQQLRQNNDGTTASFAAIGLPSAGNGHERTKNRNRIASFDAQTQDEIDTVRSELETAVLENKQLKQKCSMLDSWLDDKNTKLNHILDERITLQSTLSEREEALRKLRRQVQLLKRRRSNKMVTIKDEPETRFISPAPSTSTASSPGESAHVSADELDDIAKNEEREEVFNATDSEVQSEKEEVSEISQQSELHQVEEPSVLVVMESANGGDIVGSPSKVAHEMSPTDVDANDEEQREFLRNECAVKIKQVFRAHLARLQFLKEIQKENFKYNVIKQPEETQLIKDHQDSKRSDQQKILDDGEYSYLVKKLQALLRAHLERVRYLSSLPRV